MAANCAEHLQRWHHGARPATPALMGLIMVSGVKNHLVKAAAGPLLGGFIRRFSAAIGRIDV